MTPAGPPVDRLRRVPRLRRLWLTVVCPVDAGRSRKELLWLLLCIPVALLVLMNCVVDALAVLLCRRKRRQWNYLSLATALCLHSIRYVAVPMRSLAAASSGGPPHFQISVRYFCGVTPTTTSNDIFLFHGAFYTPRSLLHC